jgi:hypothetical protein
MRVPGHCDYGVQARSRVRCSGWDDHETAVGVGYNGLQRERSKLQAAELAQHRPTSSRPESPHPLPPTVGRPLSHRGRRSRLWTGVQTEFLRQHSGGGTRFMSCSSQVPRAATVSNGFFGDDDQDDLPLESQWTVCKLSCSHPTAVSLRTP